MARLVCLDRRHQAGARWYHCRRRYTPIARPDTDVLARAEAWVRETAPAITASLCRLDSREGVGIPSTRAPTGIDTPAASTARNAWQHVRSRSPTDCRTSRLGPRERHGHSWALGSPSPPLPRPAFPQVSELWRSGRNVRADPGHP